MVCSLTCPGSTVWSVNAVSFPLLTLSTGMGFQFPPGSPSLERRSESLRCGLVSISAGHPQPDSLGHTQGRGGGCLSAKLFYKSSPCPLSLAGCQQWGLTSPLGSHDPWGHLFTVLFPSAFRRSGWDSMFTNPSTWEELGVEEHEHALAGTKGSEDMFLGAGGEQGANSTQAEDTCLWALSSALGRTSSPERRWMTRHVQSSPCYCLEKKRSCMLRMSAVPRQPVHVPKSHRMTSMQKEGHLGRCYPGESSTSQTHTVSWSHSQS